MKINIITLWAEPQTGNQPKSLSRFLPNKILQIYFCSHSDHSISKWLKLDENIIWCVNNTTTNTDINNDNSDDDDGEILVSSL